MNFSKHVSAMLDNHTIIFDCRVSKPFACSGCVIFRAVFTNLRPTTCAEDQRFFYRNYPQINEAGKSDHMGM